MPKKILIIDDSALMRRVLSDIIGSDKRFMLSDAAGNGLEAYDLITTNPGKYDLLVLDINMPKMNGIQLLEKLNDKKIHIPTIMVSSIAKEGTSPASPCSGNHGKYRRMPHVRSANRAPRDCRGASWKP